ncbi:uncharacterized protein MONBRDRAFT_18360 [Monosiga brevicollis MX1]|uniref:Pleiotropic regulator 1 n=1 Tax=Monosiga brevicollis TaxID=81824 RepID=A9UUI5_MONBE|nr:uncharacterized protein MONBRDRAFT_18360 [Monosiga brevicollis MX1]EDQ91103.1 predicted protein [Monosiga brevicollis MX1]|eukprot:XP_001744400.1 hypothetical protein [Monosiga brevicollis MX1]
MAAEVTERDAKAAFRMVKRARDLYIADQDEVPVKHDGSRAAKVAFKVQSEYASVQHLPAPASLKRKTQSASAGPAAPSVTPTVVLNNGKGDSSSSGPSTHVGAIVPVQASGPKLSSKALAMRHEETGVPSSRALAIKQRVPMMPKPQWHPHWKLHRVVSGHTGWVRSICVEPGNQWFATGSSDRTIKIWDLASTELKLTLTGHISAVRGLAVSDRHPYLFSVGEDKTVKCWDLEQNKVVRHYHGHLSSVFCLAVHPTLDILFTGGRDATVRMWDMRSKAQIHCLSGHSNTVASLVAQPLDPQVISGSHDSTIRLWDVRMGRSLTTLTNHKKSVRALTLHPKEFTFASGAPDNIKQWYLPDGKFIQNLSGHNSIVNALAATPDNVLVSGADNGTLNFWDYKTGHRFQQMETLPQPGSLDCESGIYAMTFDKSYSRLLTAEADKSIKIYKEDPESTEERDPLDWKPTLRAKTRF